MKIEKNRFDKATLELWEELQEVDRDFSKANPYGYYSIGTRPPDMIARDILKDAVKGKCLDVGCGILPLPSYMRDQPDIEFVGVDPYDDIIDREFEFYQAIAEDLPFENNTFDGVLFATSFDHLISPEMALQEVKRVLKSDGIFIIWYSVRPEFHVGGTILNKFHQWGYTDKALSEMVELSGLKIKEIKRLTAKERMLLGGKFNIKCAHTYRRLIWQLRRKT